MRSGHLVRGTLVRLTADTLYLAVTDSLGPLAPVVAAGRVDGLRITWRGRW